MELYNFILISIKNLIYLYQNVFKKCDILKKLYRSLKYVILISLKEVIVKQV